MNNADAGYTGKVREQFPDIDCVVIGVNSEATIKRCLESIKASNYATRGLHVYYVDGGSTDNSLKIAAEVPGVKCIALNSSHPTPGKGRNSGWKSGNSDFVQFLDGDTIVDKNWLQTATNAFTRDLEEGVGAVSGNREELHPEATIYNWIASLEWNLKHGYVDSFGGDVMIRRSALIESGGYDEVMVGGEDPELSRRIVDLGRKILHLDTPMTGHDLAMTNAGQYLKRAYRTGYGFAAVIDKHRGIGNRFWFRELFRIIIRGGGCLSSLAAASTLLLLFPLSLIPLATSLALIALSLGLLFFPRLFRVDYFSRDKSLSASRAKTYSLHCSLVVLPQLFGIFRYYIGTLFNMPLHNNSRKLATATLSP
jgi:cellulose synthase/poly-beta-1,6-N-acetylglucosamine synthase-like glycosyltransferase